MKSILIALLLLCTTIAIAQQPQLTAQPILGLDSTLGANNANRALIYWDAIMAADDGTPTGPSLKAVVNALSLQAQWSDNGTTWHDTYQATDTHIRLKIRSTDAWIVIPYHTPATQAAPLTGSDIVALIAGLTANDRLSYKSLKETPSQAIVIQYSVDGTTAWHPTYVPGTDKWYRFSVSGGAPSAALPIGETSLHLSGGAGNIDSFVGGSGINLSITGTELNIAVAPTLTIAWANVRNIPSFATRWATADEVEGLDTHIQDYLERHGLTGLHAPVWRNVPRQFLRRNSHYSLNLNNLVDDATAFLATALPAGITLADGIISGTPTTEQVAFAQITATNSDGESAFTLPMIVLRDISFQTAYQNLNGLTTKGTEIIAIRGTAQTLAYAYDKHGTANNSATVTFTSGTGFNPAYAQGIAWDGTYFALLGNFTTGATSAALLYNADGSPTLSTFTVAQAAISSMGLTFGGGSYYIIKLASLDPNLTLINKLSGTTLAPIALASFQADSAIIPRGIGFLNNKLYIADDANNKVWVYQLNGTRTSTETYRDFNLDANNTEPTGITYLDNYWYVTEKETGLINDKIFIYPSKELYDPTIPNLDRVELISRGTYKTGNAIRIRATFSSAVDISSTATFRINLGGTERQAISVANQTATTAASQNNTTIANFYYAVQAADTDSDGITSYPYPFATTGTMQPAGDTLTQHSLNAATSAYRIVEPAGLGKLFASPASKVNSFLQADWNDTDPGSDGYIRNKPNALVPYPDTVSLAEFDWEHDATLGIQFNVSGTHYNQLSVFQIAPLSDWAESKTINANQTILLRIPVALVTAGTDDIYLQGITYQNQLTALRTDTDHWNVYHGALAYQDYFYYAWKTTPTSSTTIQAVKRKLPATVVSGIPKSDWDATTGPAEILNKPEIVKSDWNATTGPAEILNKPFIRNYFEGTTHANYELVYGQGEARRITPPADFLQKARDYNIPIRLELTVKWRSKTIQGDTSKVDMDAIVMNQHGTELFSKRANQLDFTNYTITKLTGIVPNDQSDFQINLNREDENTQAVCQVDSALFRMTLDEAQELKITGTAPIVVTGTDTKNIALGTLGTRINWTPTVSGTTAGVTITLHDTEAVQIGNLVMYSGQITFTRTTAGTGV